MIPPFSRRTRWDLTRNRLTVALDARRSLGKPILDLTESNPTRCALLHPESGRLILQALASPAALTYDPDPRGLRTAREAIATLLSAGGGWNASPGGTPLRADEIVVTSSTSEAYGWLFRLLCEPGDDVLVPTPSYPLFDFLARIHDVRLLPYPLIENDGFRIDIDRLLEIILESGHEKDRIRAVIFVNPGNPTGAFLTRAEHLALADLCARNGLALISDEVFGDYAFDQGERSAVAVSDHNDGARVATVAGDDRCLTFALNGLSKMLALPQMKLGWIAASGPEPTVSDALARLEVISDTYLSVGTPIQSALPDLLSMRASIQQPVHARLAANRRTLAAALTPPHPARVLPSSGGWSAIIRVPSTRTDEEWAITLLEQDGVLVQPGFFYDFPCEGRLVVSLLPEEPVFAEGIRRLSARIGAG